MECGIGRGCSLPCGAREPAAEKSVARDHPRTPCLPAASSQRVSCRPASGSRPPLGSASGHKALGQSLGSPAARPASGAPGGAPSASSHPRPTVRDSAGNGRAHRPRRPGHVQAGGTALPPDPGARPPARPSTCPSVWRSVRPPSPRVQRPLR